jgi:formylglycine-generating enzyme required for sulfatase activity
MYAFGVLLFEMLTFQLPYKAQGMEEYFDAILNKEPNLDLLQEVKVPDEVAGVIKRCLEKEPEKRFGSFGEIATLLRPFVLPERLEQFAQLAQTVIAKPETVPTPAKAPPKSRLPVMWGGIAVALLLAAVAIWLVMRRSPPLVSSPAAAVTSGERVPKSAPAGMALVDGGTALLGADAKPVTVRTFYIDTTEVTNRAYLTFCRETGHSAPTGTQQAQGDYPVVNVSMDDAQAFAAWAHKRLPSADEWEKAARGAQGLKFPWGNEWRPEAANIPPDRAAAKKAKLASVASFASGASPYGALNMVGNAWEWVNTTAIPDDITFNRLAKIFTPPLARGETFYQTKGGSYRFFVPNGHEADLVWDQSPMPARARENDLGFRCAQDP